MIVSDEHRFVFVHIPKCAGTSVRQQIARFDSTGGYFAGVKRHAELGTIDHGHIPLDKLEEHWSDAFAKLRTYRSFAIMRDPAVRFGSSLRQSLHFYAGQYTTEMTPTQARDAALRLIERLENGENLLDPKIAHFLPQVRFIYLDGKKIVSDVHDLGDLERFYDALSAITGAHFDTQRKANRDLSFRHKALVRPAYAVNAWLHRNAPLRLRDTLKRLVLPVLIHKQGATARTGLLDDPEIKAFVTRFYADDFACYNALQRPAALPA